LAANIAAFYYDYKNKQEQIFRGTWLNVIYTGAVRIEGLNFDVTERVTDEFALRGGLSWRPSRSI